MIKGIVPSYEDPIYRFLQGRGELLLGSEDGVATTLWEFLLQAKDMEYPLVLNDKEYTKSDLLSRAAQLLPHIPDEVVKCVSEEGRQKIWDMCIEVGVSPELFA